MLFKTLAIVILLSLLVACDGVSTNVDDTHPTQRPLISLNSPEKETPSSDVEENISGENEEGNDSKIADRNDNDDGPIGPVVLATHPANNDSAVNVDSVIEVTFSESMALASINKNSFRVFDRSGVFVEGETTYDFVQRTATFVPATNFSRNSVYTVHLSNKLTAESGETLQEAVEFKFSTELPVLNVEDVVVSEMDASATIRFVIDNPSGSPARLSYITEGSQAADSASEDDYTSTMGDIIFPPGETEHSIVIDIHDDDIYENEEIFFVKFSKIDGLNVNRNQVAVTISSEDPLPLLSVNDAVVNEALGQVNIILELDRLSAFPITVDYKDGDLQVGNFAIAGIDYIISPGTATIAAGAWNASIVFPIVKDVLSESTEDFLVSLDNISGGTLARQLVKISITDNNGLPVLSMPQELAVNEQDATVNLQVNLDQTSGQRIFVDYFTQNGSAVSGVGNDFLETSGTLIYEPGQLTALIQIPLINDNLSEADETFYLKLENPVNAFNEAAANIANINNQAAIRIRSNGTSPTFQVTLTEPVRVTEGATSVSVGVSLSETSGQPISINYSTLDGSAESGKDYIAKTGTLVFAPGEVEKVIDVALYDYDIYEGDEQFSVVFSVNANEAVVLGVSNLSITIVDNESTPVFSVENTVVNESDQSVNVLISVFPASAQAISVDYRLAAGTAVPVSTGSAGDYTDGAGSIVFDNENVLSKTISIPIENDLLFELDENFELILENPSFNALLNNGKATATITINSEDIKPTASVLSFVSGLESTGTARIDVSLDSVSGVDTIVSFATSPIVDGVFATAGIDYIAIPNGMLTIPAGNLFSSINVEIIDDRLYENTEYFLLDLTNADFANISLSQKQSLVMVESDDVNKPTLSIEDMTMFENSGIAKAKVSLSEVSGADVNFNFTTFDGSATAPDDFITIQNATATINKGELFTWVDVEFVNDDVIETDEQFEIHLSGAVNSNILDGVGLITIRNDDNLPTPTLSITNGDGEVTLTWPSVTGALTYNLYYARQPGVNASTYNALGGSILLNQTSGVSITDLKLWVDYYFVVTSVANTYESPASEEVQVRTKIIPWRTLNDTGVTFGGNSLEENNLTCVGDVIDQQDCSVGRDSTHNDDADGNAGFSYTKIGGDGNALLETATSWDCVKDNVTGLMWEVKQPANSGGLRDSTWTYSWFNSTGVNDAGTLGTVNENVGVCLDTLNCDTEKFVSQVNLVGICGFNDWRMPDVLELQTLIDRSKTGPSIDINYFPNITNNVYWTSSPNNDYFGGAWQVDFRSGILNGKYRRSSPFYVRLVRSAN